MNLCHLAKFIYVYIFNLSRFFCFHIAEKHNKNLKFIQAVRKEMHPEHQVVAQMLLSNKIL